MRSSSSVLLIGLAVADTLTLWINLPEHWIAEGLQYNYTEHLILCKISDFLMVPIRNFSVYSIVIFTIFRLISVYVPHKAKVLCTRKRAYFALIFTYVIFQLAGIFDLIVKKVERVSYYGDIEYHCTWGDYDTFNEQYYQSITLVIITIIPSIVIIGGNILIIVKISKRKGPGNETLKNDGGESYMSNDTESSSKVDHQKPTITSQKTGSMNLVLMAVSLLFILSNMPFTVTNIIFGWVDIESYGTETEFKFYLWEAVAKLLTYLNNIGNFGCYFISGSKFRQELKIMIFGKNRQAEVSTQLSRISGCGTSTMP